MSKLISLSFILLIFGISFYFLFFRKEEAPPPPLKETMDKKPKAKLEEKKISIITLYDNYQVEPELKTGWGFSALIKTENKNILFDTGAESESLLYNMKKMKISPKEINIIAFSHIHGDHIGGMDGFLKVNGNVKVYIPASFPSSIRQKIKSYGGEYVDVTDSIKIVEGIYSTGELGVLIKEQSLIINTEKGLVVITGCAHPGVVNIVRRTKEIFPQEEIFLVLGGFHLSGASDVELENIISDFRKLGVKKVAPCHCSGNRCRELFEEEYKENFIENGVGKIIEI